MTDNEIIKALESLLDRMRAYETQQASIGKGLVEHIISMYDHQKAENERLQIRNKTLTDISQNYDWKFAKVKAEAIKEFAERLKERTATFYSAVGIREEADNLVKEMTEENEK